MSENQQDVIESLRQQLADHLKREVMLRGLVEQSRGSVKFDLNRYEQLLEIKRRVGVEKSAQYIAMDIEANRLSKTLDGIDEALAATADLEGLILCEKEPCRDDGRCQYAIDHGAEGLGHCQEGKCCMPLYRAWEPKP